MEHCLEMADLQARQNCKARALTLNCEDKLVPVVAIELDDGILLDETLQGPKRLVEAFQPLLQVRFVHPSVVDDHAIPHALEVFQQLCLFGGLNLVFGHTGLLCCSANPPSDVLQGCVVVGTKHAIPFLGILEDVQLLIDNTGHIQFLAACFCLIIRRTGSPDKL